MTNNREVEDDACPGCGDGDKVPARGYFRCPVCDAEWDEPEEPSPNLRRDLVGAAAEAGSGVETEAEALAAKDREIERLKAERDDAVAKRGKWCDDVRANITATRREMFAQFARAEAAEAANTRLTSQVEKLMEVVGPFAQFFSPDPPYMPDDMQITQGSSLARKQLYAKQFRALRTVYDSIKEGLGEAAAEAGSGVETEGEAS